MSEKCKKTPCHDDPCHEKLPEFGPDDPVNPDPTQCTLCTGDTSNNVFFSSRAPGFPGRCVLDEMTYEQVSMVIQRVPGAKEDLMRITDDPLLLKLASESCLVESPLDENERVQKRINANTLPMYTVLCGNIDGTPGIRR